MLFNSLAFALFLPVVFAIYWLLNRLGTVAQNILLLLASYLFYGWWDYRFLFLIALSSLIDFLVGLRLASTQGRKKRRNFLYLSLAANLGMLGFFKYFNFFSESLALALSGLGINASPILLNLILPVGISFYTFQTLSYTIDVYRGILKAEKDPVAFFAYVSFFPQLVAGPIERAKTLLPQFKKPRVFDPEMAKDGLRQMLWGFVKKILIADQVGGFVSQVYQNHYELDGSTLLLGAMAFLIQVYGDFSGYSDIAIGTAKLFGFRLMDNFRTPFFASNFNEFWKRWHISLMTWLRDYVYIPLGGSRGSSWLKYRNLFLVFFLSGIWHGASWNFVIWGTVLGIAMVLELIFREQRLSRGLNLQSTIPSVIITQKLAGACYVFIFISLSMIPFRAENLGHAGAIWDGIVSYSLLSIPQLPVWQDSYFLLFFSFFLVEWWGRSYSHPLAKLPEKLPVVLRWFFYSGWILAIFYFMPRSGQFIYFQF